MKKLLCFILISILITTALTGCSQDNVNSVAESDFVSVQSSHSGEEVSMPSNESVESELPKPDYTMSASEKIPVVVLSSANSYAVITIANTKNVEFEVDTSCKIEVLKDGKWSTVEVKDDSVSIQKIQSDGEYINYFSLNLNTLGLETMFTEYRFTKEIDNEYLSVEFEVVKEDFSSINEGLGKVAEDFLKAIKEKDITSICSLLGTLETKAYAFFTDFDLEGFKIINVDNIYPYVSIVTAELDIKNSKTKLFPNGKISYKLLAQTSDWGSIGAIIPADKELQFNPDVVISDAASKCYSYSVYLNRFDSVSDVSKIAPQNTKQEMFDEFCVRLSLMLYDNSGKTPIGDRKTIENGAKNFLGLDIDLTKCTNYNAENDELEGVNKVGFWISSAVISDIKDSNTGKTSIVFEYYLDSAKLIVAKRIKYTLKQNDDGSFRLLSTELLFDSGYEIRDYLK